MMKHTKAVCETSFIFQQIVLVFAIIFFLLVSQIRAEGDKNKIDDFSIKNLKLGMSLEDAKKIYPEAEEEKRDPRHEDFLFTQKLEVVDEKEQEDSTEIKIIIAKASKKLYGKGTYFVGYFTEFHQKHGYLIDKEEFMIDFESSLIERYGNYDKKVELVKNKDNSYMIYTKYCWGQECEKVMKKIRTDHPSGVTQSRFGNKVKKKNITGKFLYVSARVKKESGKLYFELLDPEYFHAQKHYFKKRMKEKKKTKEKKIDY